MTRRAETAAGRKSAEGYTAKFGLFSIDFDDPELRRRRTPAVVTFREVARNMGLSPVGP